MHQKQCIAIENIMSYTQQYILFNKHTIIHTYMQLIVILDGNGRQIYV